MVYVVPLLTLFNSIHFTAMKYDNYYKDLVYMMQTESVQVDWYTKIHYISFEFFLQFLSSFVSYYWVDEVHTCMFDIQRQHQSTLFLTVISITFVLHVGHHQQTKKQTEYFVRHAYNHVNNIDV